VGIIIISTVCNTVGLFKLLTFTVPIVNKTMAGFSYNIVIEYLQCCVKKISIEGNVFVCVNDSNTTGVTCGAGTALKLEQHKLQ
jgi:hypothetical protein